MKRGEKYNHSELLFLVKNCWLSSKFLVNWEIWNCFKVYRKNNTHRQSLENTAIDFKCSIYKVALAVKFNNTEINV